MKIQFFSQHFVFSRSRAFSRKFQRSLASPANHGSLARLLMSLVAGAAVLGCGDNERSNRPSDLENGDGDLAVNFAGASSSGDGDFGGLDEGGTCRSLAVGDGCSGEVYEGEAAPLDLYLMFDQSGSMSTVVDEKSGAMRIDVVRQAVRAFLDDEQSVGIGVGIGYFGDQSLGSTTCDPADYAIPDVKIGALPAREAALVESLERAEPTGETPTGAAIRGACEYVSSYRAGEGSGRNPAILFVTDGEPKAPLSEATCAPTLKDAIAAAEACFTDEGIRTYVLGVGPSLTNLNDIAQAGGSKTAYLADLDNADQVLAALRAVRLAAQLPCDLLLDEKAISADFVDTNETTVAYLNLGCEYQAIKEVANQPECADGRGWYFDDPDAPRAIHLCEATCGDVKSEGRQLFYSLGCPLQVVR